MNVTFLHDDPINTVIINSADGQPLYEVKTPLTISNRTTSIRRTEPGVAAGQGSLVAEVHWHSWRPSEVNFLGSTMRMDEFLRQDSKWNSSRIITGNDGRLYKWELHSSTKLTLVDRQTKAIVSESHRRKIGLFTNPRKMNVDILPSGMEAVDSIIVSFIIMEEEQRESQAGVS